MLNRLMIAWIFFTSTQAFGSFLWAQASIPAIDIHTGRIEKSSVSEPLLLPVRPRKSSLSVSDNRRILSATVRLASPKGTRFAYGSGTIVAVNRQGALVATCAHTFRESQGKKPVYVTLFANGVQSQVVGRVLSINFDTDVGFVLVPGVHDILPIPIAEAGYPVKVGTAVVAAGCDLGGEPVAETTAVCDIDRYHGPASLNVTAKPAHGRSGGGLITEDYRLIGVCTGIDTLVKDGIYTGLECIHRELAKIQSNDADFHATRARVNESLGDVMPKTSGGSGSKPAIDVERKPVDVICIIQSEPASEKGRIVFLKSVSHAFLDALENERTESLR